ncbi:MAG: hypothetical protein NZL87_10550, partial [Thermomicrobium sp.]|nr:hypothetical protein [Thermomicrobium sp.]
MLHTEVLRPLAGSPSLTSVRTTLREHRRVVVDALPAAARPALIAALTVDLPGPMLVVAPRQSHADELAAALAHLVTDRPVLVWQAPETLPYDIFAQERSVAAERIAFLARL